MWQNWLSGILGLWVILMPFLNLPENLPRTLTIVTGVVIAVLGFWAASGSKAEGAV